MFWIIFIVFIMSIIGIFTVFGLFFDLYIKYFGYITNANIHYVNILDKSNNNIKNGGVYNLKIKYCYEFNGIQYHSSCINSFFDLTRTNQYEIERELNILDDKIKIYVFKYYPSIAMTHPLKANKIFIFIAIFIGVVVPAFIGYLLFNNLTVFDVLLN